MRWKERLCLRSERSWFDLERCVVYAEERMWSVEMEQDQATICGKTTKLRMDLEGHLDDPKGYI